jgi:hypothetical protein
VASDDLPLLRWQPPALPCAVFAFPLVRRVGKVRDVARKMAAKRTARHVDTYRDQVTTALLRHLDRIGVPEAEQDEQLGAFWLAVQAEMIRLRYSDHGTGGAA